MKMELIVQHTIMTAVVMKAKARNPIFLDHSLNKLQKMLSKTHTTIEVENDTPVLALTCETYLPSIICRIVVWIYAPRSHWTPDHNYNVLYFYLGYSKSLPKLFSMAFAWIFITRQIILLLKQITPYPTFLHCSHVPL